MKLAQRFRATRRILLAALIVLTFHLVAFGQREYGFDNRKASGQPYLKPEESIARMKVHPGWEVKLFAAEPDVVNPIAFTIDERGRVWVVECFEYPSRTPKDRMPRDRIIILEDTDGDGKADKRTVWAEGKDFPVRFDLASGIEVGHGGVFLGAPPYLWFLQDTNGDGKCDKYEILLKGFGSQDTHETLNTFQWGPDGRLYGLHGVFTHSEVAVADNPSPPGPLSPKRREGEEESPPFPGREGGPGGLGSAPVKMNAAVWRYDVRTKKFDIFAEGTSNPWGMDFDANGNCFLCCCVIPHLFHIVPGGIYIRQAGSSFNPYAFGYLKEICDHTHHKESGWAHAGLLVLDGSHVPDDLRGSVLMGSIHGCSIKRDVLRRNGSTFIAGHAEDFLVSGDKNFRPINLRWGPAGDIYVIDWHDQNPCHQAPPDSWDKTHGRIYRIQRTGTKGTGPGDLSKRTSQELAELVSDENPWKHRTAMRLLIERAKHDQGARKPSLDKYRSDQADLGTHWMLHAMDVFSDERIGERLAQMTALTASRPEETQIRAWTVRLVGESMRVTAKTPEHFTALAGKEASPEVRLQLASTAQRLHRLDTVPILHNLMQHKEDATDPMIPLMIWLAYEPKLAAKPQAELSWLKENAAGNPLITDHIIPRVMRRLVATGKPEDLAACVAFLGDVKDKDVRRQALRGLNEALKGRQIEPPGNWDAAYAQLKKADDDETQRLTNQLAVAFRDAKAILRALATLREPSSSKADRLDAMRNLGVAHPAEALRPLLDLVANEKDEELRRAAAHALRGYDSAEIPAAVLGRWKEYPTAVRIELVSLLQSRREWARRLLEAVGKGAVPRTDLTDNTILAIRSFNDSALNEQIEKVWGRYRQTPEELEKLIVKMRGFVTEAPGDAERGRKVFEKNCMQCHRFDGKGHDVAPDLDGAERSIDYLLINVLDPNRVIGQPYYQRIIELKGGKIVTGIVAAEDGQSITLKRENDARDIIQRGDIQEMKTVEKSLMPEGLGNNMTPAEFRDLVYYLVRREKKPKP